jgi:hypothetical protein
VERSFGRDSGVASLHHYDGQTAGRSQRAAHPAEVARRLRQWRRRCGRGGCADRYHHYFQLLDSHTNTNANGNSADTDSHAEREPGDNTDANNHADPSDADSDSYSLTERAPFNSYTDANTNPNANSRANTDGNPNPNADSGSAGRQPLYSDACADR